MLAAASLLNVRGKRPLTDAPILYRADAIFAHAFHLRLAPIWLACDCAEVRFHLDANVMATRVIVT